MGAGLLTIPSHHTQVMVHLQSLLGVFAHELSADSKLSKGAVIITFYLEIYLILQHAKLWFWCSRHAYVLAIAYFHCIKCWHSMKIKCFK